MRPFRLAVALPLAALALVLGGCSVSVAQSELETQVGNNVDGSTDVACDGELAGEVGATQTCTVSGGGGESVDVVATVTEVDGKTVIFDIDEAAAE